MRFTKNKQIILLSCFLLFTVLGRASTGGPSVISIQATQSQSVPKSSSIQATIEGHILSVVFLENLGQVSVEVTTASGGVVDAFSSPTPNGMNICIPNAGNYIVTFTLPNGDEYYGEFEVTD